MEKTSLWPLRNSRSNEYNKNKNIKIQTIILGFKKNPEVKTNPGKRQIQTTKLSTDKMPLRQFLQNYTQRKWQQQQTNKPIPKCKTTNSEEEVESRRYTIHNKNMGPKEE